MEIHKIIIQSETEIITSVTLSLLYKNVTDMKWQIKGLQKKFKVGLNISR